MTKEGVERVAAWLEAQARDVRIEALAPGMLDQRGAISAEYLRAAHTLRAAAWFARPSWVSRTRATAAQIFQMRKAP